MWNVANRKTFDGLNRLNFVEKLCYEAYTKIPTYRCNCAKGNRNCTILKEIFEKENDCIKGRVDSFNFKSSDYSENDVSGGKDEKSEKGQFISIGIGIFIGSALLVILSAYAYTKLKTNGDTVLIGAWKG